MKRTLLLVPAFMMIVGCTNHQYNNTDTLQTESVEEEVLPVDESLIKREYDEYSRRTSVNYALPLRKNDCVVKASYNINEEDILGNKMDQPKTEDFRIHVIAHKRGATNIARVEFTANGGCYEMKPNFTQRQGSGRFEMLFNSTWENRGAQKALATADSATVKVVYDNGSETYTLTKEDLQSIDVIYRSYLLDGGVFE